MKKRISSIICSIYKAMLGNYYTSSFSENQIRFVKQLAEILKTSFKKNK